MQQQKRNTLVSLLNENLFIGIIITKVKGLSLFFSLSLAPFGRFKFFVLVTSFSLSLSLSLSLSHPLGGLNCLSLFSFSLTLSQSLAWLCFCIPNETVLS